MSTEIWSRLKAMSGPAKPHVKHPLDRACLQVERETVDDRVGFGIADLFGPPGTNRTFGDSLEIQPEPLPRLFLILGAHIVWKRSQPIGGELDRIPRRH